MRDIDRCPPRRGGSRQCRQGSLQGNILRDKTPSVTRYARATSLNEGGLRFRDSPQSRGNIVGRADSARHIGSIKKRRTLLSRFARPFPFGNAARRGLRALRTYHEIVRGRFVKRPYGLIQCSWLLKHSATGLPCCLRQIHNTPVRRSSRRCRRKATAAAYTT